MILKYELGFVALTLSNLCLLEFILTFHCACGS